MLAVGDPPDMFSRITGIPALVLKFNFIIHDEIKSLSKTLAEGDLPRVLSRITGIPTLIS